MNSLISPSYKSLGYMLLSLNVLKVFFKESFVSFFKE